MSANLKNYKAGTGTRIHAPTGTSLSCKGWHQEAAMRMLMNNLDPDVAETVSYTHLRAHETS